MSLPVFDGSGVKVYSLSNNANGTSAQSGIPAWLAKENDRKLRKDDSWRNRVELIQDFEFPEASLRIKKTRDGKHIMATGVYKPQMRVFELSEMSMKFERHSDCDNVQFLLLNDDWTKSVHLQSNRSLEFHSQSGIHYKTRIPRFGRDLAYHYPSCDLLVVGASNEVYRLNLQQGQYLNSLNTDMPGINAASINPAHELFIFGGEDGMIEFWDPRSRASVRKLNVAQSLVQHPSYTDTDALKSIEITKLVHGFDGLSLAVGTSTGQVLMYDLRSNQPRLVKDHMYNTPIVGIDFYVGNGGVGEAKMVTADRKSVKIWSRETGKPYAAIEPDTDINDLLLFAPDSGLVMLANEGVPVQTFFIPELGPAPRWCHFLDNLTEEMEESKAPVVYDNYKFVTKTELDSLALSHLVGTPMLRAYMHGYFIDLRLYEKARAIANPFAFKEYQEKVALEKLEKERGSRIGLVAKLPKVNRRLAAQLLAKVDAKIQGGQVDDATATTDEDDDEFKATVKRSSALLGKSKSDATLNPTGDDRFSKLFADPDFAIDETTEEFRLKYPTIANATSKVSTNYTESDADSSAEDEILAQHPLLAKDKDSPTSDSDSEGLSDSESAPSIVDEDSEPRGRIIAAVSDDRPRSKVNLNTVMKSAGTIAKPKFDAFSSSDAIALRKLNSKANAGTIDKQTLAERFKLAQSQLVPQSSDKRPFRQPLPSGNMTFTVTKSDKESKDKPLTLGEQAAFREREKARLSSKRSVKQLNLRKVR